MIRKTSVAGSFYPARQDEIERYIAHFNTLIEGKIGEIPTDTKAVIVPHAGYIYSGFSANVAYRFIHKSPLERFVVIGPSHRIGFVGSSCYPFERYETPLGDLNGDMSLAGELTERFSLLALPQAHEEHSSETQFPLLKHYKPDAKIVEIVYSDESPQNLAQVIDYLLQKEDVGIVISTDLSHFYTLEQANALDSRCIEAVANIDAATLHAGCEACGKIGVEALLLCAKERSLHSQILDYRTSADASGDKERVVGYLSARFF